MIIDVYYPFFGEVNADAHLRIPKNAQYFWVHRFATTETDVLTALDAAFRDTNRVEEGDYWSHINLRSSMVGDIFTADGKAYLVQLAGFREMQAMVGNTTLVVTGPAEFKEDDVYSLYPDAMLLLDGPGKEENESPVGVTGARGPNRQPAASSGDTEPRHRGKATGVGTARGSRGSRGGGAGVRPRGKGRG